MHKNVQPRKIPKIDTTLLLFYVDMRIFLKAIRGDGYHFVAKGGTFPTETIMLVDSGPFCGLLLAVSGPGGISTIDEPLVRLCFGHQQSRFLSILSLSSTLLTVFGS